MPRGDLFVMKKGRYTGQVSSHGRLNLKVRMGGTVLLDENN